jgi:arylsulfatase A
MYLAFTALFSCSAGTGPKAAETGRPSILLLVADDLGYEKLGCYGGVEVSTPRLDEMAGNGMLFRNAYTSPVCTPSRMSLYTGSYEPRHKYSVVLPVHEGTRDAVDFENRFICYARLLREAGYRTSVTGKWQLATLEHHPGHIKSAGFDSWCVWQIWRDGQKTLRYWNPTLNRDGRILEADTTDFGPDILTDYVIEQMRTAKQASQPFLIHHNIMLPHTPIIRTPLDMEMNREAGLDHMISYMDLQVGRIMEAIHELDLDEQTIVFFMGDNGTQSRIPRNTIQGMVTGGKHILSDGGMHVPLIAWGPGRIPSNAMVDDLVDFADFFPTICELAGVEIPEGANPDGISFAAPLLGRGPGTRKWITAGIHDNFCVFDGQWRLHHINNTLIDCRELPVEKPAHMDSASAQAAMERLLPVLEELRKL